jgi:hypothetical protein
MKDREAREEAWLTLRVRNAVEQEQKLPARDRAHDWEDLGLQKFTDGLFMAPDRSTVFTFVTEMGMLRYFVQFLSTAVDVLVGWKMLHEFEVDQSLHYVFNRMMSLL